jgi:hypothetical protein
MKLNKAVCMLCIAAWSVGCTPQRVPTPVKPVTKELFVRARLLDSSRRGNAFMVQIISTSECFLVYDGVTGVAIEPMTCVPVEEWGH